MSGANSQSTRFHGCGRSIALPEQPQASQNPKHGGNGQTLIGPFGPQARLRDVRAVPEFTCSVRFSEGWRFLKENATWHPGSWVRQLWNRCARGCERRSGRRLRGGAHGGPAFQHLAMKLRNQQSSGSQIARFWTLDGPGLHLSISACLDAWTALRMPERDGNLMKSACPPTGELVEGWRRSLHWESIAS